MPVNFAAIRTLLLDMDGVLYRGEQVLPGVNDLLQFCQQHDIAVGCITNNATRTQAQYGTKLARMGIAIPGERVLTSALATAAYLREHYPAGTSVYIVGMQGLEHALLHDGYFRAAAEDEHPALVVQGLHVGFTYAHLRRAALAIRAGAHFIATNPDRTFPSEEGLTPGAGAITAALEAATDTTATVIGKPQPTMFTTATHMLGGDPASTLIIGDRLDTDIVGGQRAGLHTALVLTGVTTRATLETSPVQPDAVFSDLPAVLQAWRNSNP